MPTPCNCNNTYTTPCNCTQVQTTICSQPLCVETPCACPVLISSDCTNNVTVDLPCLNVAKGKTLNEWMLAVDTAICAKFLAVQSYFKLINVGTGIGKIYKGINILGEKEIKSIKAGNLITVTDLTNEVEVGVNQIALDSIIPIANNVGTGLGLVFKNKVLNVLNFRKLKTENTGVTGASILKVESTDLINDNVVISARKIKTDNSGAIGESILKTEIENINDITISAKKLKSSTLDIKTSLDGNTITIDKIDNFSSSTIYINNTYNTAFGASDGSIVRPYLTYDEARIRVVGSGSIAYPQNAGSTIVLQTNATTAINPTINYTTIVLQDTSLIYTGNDIYAIDSEVLYPNILKDIINNEITAPINIHIKGVGSIERNTPGGFIRSIGAKRGTSTTVNNPNSITISIGGTEKDKLYIREFISYPNSILEGDMLTVGGAKVGDSYNPPRDLKWTTQLNPTNALVYSKGTSFTSFTYPIMGTGELYIETLVNTGLHVEDTNLFFKKITVVPVENIYSVVQGSTFVPTFPGVYEPKNAPAIYVKNVALFIESIEYINYGTFQYNGYDKFFKIEGFFSLEGTINYDTNYYIKVFADLTGTTQSAFEINGVTKSANLNSNIHYLIDSNITGNFNLVMPNTNLSTVRNISKNLSTIVIPNTKGTVSSINNKPYLSDIANYINDSTAMSNGLLKNALYFNTTTNAVDIVS